MPIDMSCPACSQKYRLKDSFAGKKAKCAKCGASILVPALEPAEVEPALDLGDLLDDRFPTSEETSSLHATTSPAPIAPTRPRPTADSTTSLGAGALASFAGALVGAAVWVGIALTTGYEIGWIAWGLGALAGLGMAYGHRGDDGNLPGIIAGAMSIAGILAAKGFVYQYYQNQLAAMGITGDVLAEWEAAVGESISFASMFSPMDALFIVLALGSAYQIGNGSVGE